MAKTSKNIEQMENTMVEQMVEFLASSLEIEIGEIVLPDLMSDSDTDQLNQDEQTWGLEPGVYVLWKTLSGNAPPVDLWYDLKIGQMTDGSLWVNFDRAFYHAHRWECFNFLAHMSDRLVDRNVEVKWLTDGLSFRL